MTSKALLIQQIYPASDYRHAITLTIGRTLEYCARHDMDYQFVVSKIVEEWDMKYGGWAKLPLILGALDGKYEHVIYLDADTVIADMDADLRDGCPEFGIGLTYHSPDGNPVFNVGTMYVTNSEKVRNFLREWIRWFPGPLHGWHEQAMLNLFKYVPEFGALIVPIDDKWNSTRKGNNHVDNAAVEGFHGEGDPLQRIAIMREFMNALTP